jgi:hypothetical protein
MSEELSKKFKELIERSNAEEALKESVLSSSPAKMMSSANVRTSSKPERKQYWVYLLGIVLLLIIGYYLLYPSRQTSAHMRHLEDDVNNSLNFEDYEKEVEDEEDLTASSDQSDRLQTMERTETADPFFQHLTVG